MKERELIKEMMVLGFVSNAVDNIKKIKIMTEKRMDELGKIIGKYTVEFKENANTEERFGVLYLSCDMKKNNIDISLECARKPFIRMIISLMSASPEIAEDIITATKSYWGKDPMKLRLITEEL